MPPWETPTSPKLMWSLSPVPGPPRPLGVLFSMSVTREFAQLSRLAPARHGIPDSRPRSAAPPRPREAPPPADLHPLAAAQRAAQLRLGLFHAQPVGIADRAYPPP